MKLKSQRNPILKWKIDFRALKCKVFEIFRGTFHVKWNTFITLAPALAATIAEAVETLKVS